MTVPAVELQGVRVAFGGAAPALAGVDLRVEPGSFVALVGGSGSGKTTLLKTVNGLVRPDAGVVRVEGEEVSAAAGPALRRRIGYVFQEVGLFPHMTVAENVALPLRLAGQAPAERARRVDALLELVALPREVGGRAPAALSGGQRQRVGVARALAAEPRLLLMDEPFGALDPATREGLGARVAELHARLGLTTLMVTHDMGEALLLADRVVVLEAGRAVADRTPAELVSDPSPHPAVAALLEPPRRQAEKLRALEAGGG